MKPYIFGSTMRPYVCRGIAIPTHYFTDHWGGFHASIAHSGDLGRLMVGATIWNAHWQWSITLELLTVRIVFGWSERL
jgi:hypothetical protein